MTFAPREENTLGTIVGRGRRNISEATRRVVRAAVPRRSEPRNRLHRDRRASSVVALRATYGFAWCISLWLGGTYPDPLPAFAAWGGPHRRDRAHPRGARGPTATSSRAGCSRCSWSASRPPSTLDLIAIWPLHDVGQYATAAGAPRAWRSSWS